MLKSYVRPVVVLTRLNVVSRRSGEFQLGGRGREGSQRLRSGQVEAQRSEEVRRRSASSSMSERGGAAQPAKSCAMVGESCRLRASQYTAPVGVTCTGCCNSGALVQLPVGCVGCICFRHPYHLVSGKRLEQILIIVVFSVKLPAEQKSVFRNEARTTIIYLVFPYKK